MTNPQPAASWTSWRRLLLAALAAILGVLLGAGTASAVTLPTVETRVGAIPATTPVTVGFDTGVWASQHQVNSPPQTGTVAGSCVAAKSAGEAARTEVSVSSRMAQSCLNSFTGSTVVLMADGTKKPIRDIQVGDRVMAKDPATGEQRPEQVVRLIRHAGVHVMIAVRLADGSVIDATDQHPFWVQSRGIWVDAIDLRIGDRVESSAGLSVAVTGFGVRSEDLTAYNLTVENLHTYFAGGDPVLVHNAGCDPADLRDLSDSYVKRLLKQFDTEPHAFKEEFVGRGDIAKFDVKMGPGGELHLVNKDGSVVIPTGVVPGR